MSRAGDALRDVLARPTWPLSVERPPARSRTGLGYDTTWARRTPARLVRAMITDNLTRPLAHLATRPVVHGREALSGLEGPAIVVANHTSHLDTAVLLSVLPSRYRHHIVVAAAADYFFDRTWKAATSSLLLGAIPVERTRVNRRSADLAAGLIDDGWSLLIFPEGGRSEDGWGQEFHGGAAYLAKRCGVPLVPVHLRGMRPLLAKGRATLSPGTVEIRFGTPLRPGLREDGRDEEARHLSARLEEGVARLAAEAETDWWQAQRAPATSYRGPQASPWRRAWALPESARPRRAHTRTNRRPW